MRESLKDLSDRATPGPWVSSKWGYQILTGDSWNTICTFHSDGKDHRLARWENGRGAKEPWSNSEFVSALVTAWFGGELHDATALAQATAQARREALEEAAKAADEVVAGFNERNHIGRMAAFGADEVAAAIRDLIDKPQAVDTLDRTEGGR